MKCQNGIDYDECNNEVVNGYCDDCEEKQYEHGMETLVENT